MRTFVHPSVWSPQLSAEPVAAVPWCRNKSTSRHGRGHHARAMIFGISQRAKAVAVVVWRLELGTARIRSVLRYERKRGASKRATGVVDEVSGAIGRARRSGG